jgi:proteic killer suppression protein
MIFGRGSGIRTAPRGEAGFGSGIPRTGKTLDRGANMKVCVWVLDLYSSLNAPMVSVPAPRLFAEICLSTKESLIVTLDVNHASRYAFYMIVSFKSTDTEALASGRRVNRFVNIESVARRKLRQLQVAAMIKDLSVPPGNRLEALSGNREGQYSIRVNDQYRVCFRLTAAGAEDVEIVDCH